MFGKLFKKKSKKVKFGQIEFTLKNGDKLIFVGYVSTEYPLCWLIKDYNNIFHIVPARIIDDYVFFENIDRNEENI